MNRSIMENEVPGQHHYTNHINNQTGQVWLRSHVTASDNHVWTSYNNDGSKMTLMALYQFSPVLVVLLLLFCLSLAVAAVVFVQSSCRQQQLLLWSPLTVAVAGWVWRSQASCFAEQLLFQAGQLECCFYYYYWHFAESWANGEQMREDEI